MENTNNSGIVGGVGHVLRGAFKDLYASPVATADNDEIRDVRLLIYII